MYTVIIPNNVKRDLKKLDTKALQAAITIMDNLSIDPFHGSMLAGISGQIRKFNFRESSVQYRLVYKIYQAELTIVILLVGTRENFYRELKRRI